MCIFCLWTRLGRTLTPSNPQLYTSYVPFDLYMPKMAPEMATLACQRRQNGDFGMPVWRHIRHFDASMASYPTSRRRNVGYAAIPASKCWIWRHTGVEMSDMAPYWRRNVGYGAILASKCRIWRVEMLDMAPYWHRNVGYGTILASKCRICRHTGVEMSDIWRHTGVEMSDMAPYWRRNVGYGATQTLETFAVAK